MKQDFTTLLCLLFFANVSWGQVNNWTWIGGNDTLSANEVYGTVGVSAAANLPGSRFSGANWTDQNGNFWPYGGVCFCNMGNKDVQSDL